MSNSKKLQASRYRYLKKETDQTRRKSELFDEEKEELLNELTKYARHEVDEFIEGDV